MEIIQEVALAIIGFAGGVSVAAGTFALITALGIVPRLAARMGVAGHVYKLESVIVLGGTIGSLLSVYHFLIIHNGNTYVRDLTSPSAFLPNPHATFYLRNCEVCG